MGGEWQIKFPGKRKSRHSFPVSVHDFLLQRAQPEQDATGSWIVGIDQTRVDIEARVDDDFLSGYGLNSGHALVVGADIALVLYGESTRKNLITHQFAGGAIGNTLCNQGVLAEE